MYNYIKGIIVSHYSDCIVLDNNGIGYQVYVSNPYEFTKGQTMTVYIYQQVREDANTLFGFKTEEEKDLFLHLIKVKGIGCKTAIGILATGDVNAIVTAIENKNVAYLKKIPGIGPKAAQQIILDLQGKLTAPQEEIIVSQEFEEASEVLLALGYKQSEVTKVMNALAGETLDTNGYVKKALAMMVK